MKDYLRSTLSVFVSVAVGFVAGICFVFAVETPPRIHTQRGGAIATVGDIEKSERPKLAGGDAWSALESEDLPVLVQNLRSFGCPELFIAAIVHGRLGRAAARESNPLEKYWSTPEELAARAAEREAARREQAKILEELKVARAFSPSGGLDAEGQARVSEALELYPKIHVTASSSPAERAQATDNLRMRIRYLQGYLTSPELLDYRMLEDSTAGGIGAMIRDIEPTEDEVVRAFLAVDGSELHRTNGWFAPDVEAKLKEALGSDRYAQYHEEVAPESAILNGWASQYGLSKEQVRAVKELRLGKGAQVVTPQFLQTYRSELLPIVQNSRAVDQFLATPSCFLPPRDGPPTPR